MKSIKLIGIIFMLLVLMPATVSAISYNLSEIAKKEYVTSQYGKLSCSLGIGDCIYLITNKDTFSYYQLDRAKLLPGSIVDSKSQISATINLGQTASITYTIKGSGADGFNAHNQRYEWYDYYGKYMNTFSINNLPLDKEHVVIQKIASPPKPGGYGYTIVEFIEINLENQCWYSHTNPCSERYRQVWAKADEFYPDVIVLGVTPTPTPTYTASPTPYPTYQPYPTYTPEPVPTVPTYTPPTTTPLKPKIIPKPIADFIGVKETPGFEGVLTIIGLFTVITFRRKL